MLKQEEEKELQTGAHFHKLTLSKQIGFAISSFGQIHPIISNQST